MATKRKYNEVTLKTKELDKKRSNKEGTIQLNVPGRILATWKKNKEKIYQTIQNSSLK